MKFRLKINKWIKVQWKKKCHSQEQQKSRVQWLIPVFPALWEVKVSGSSKVRSSRPAWLTRRNPISTKNTKKISREWWRMTVIPVTQKAEAGESLELRRWRLRWAEIMPLHSTDWATRAKPRLKKKGNRNYKITRKSKKCLRSILRKIQNAFYLRNRKDSLTTYKDNIFSCLEREVS